MASWALAECEIYKTEGSGIYFLILWEKDGYDSIPLNTSNRREAIRAAVDMGYTPECWIDLKGNRRPISHR